MFARSNSLAFEHCLHVVCEKHCNSFLLTSKRTPLLCSATGYKKEKEERRLSDDVRAARLRSPKFCQYRRRGGRRTCLREHWWVPFRTLTGRVKDAANTLVSLGDFSSDTANITALTNHLISTDPVSADPCFQSSRGTWVN